MENLQIVQCALERGEGENWITGDRGRIHNASSISNPYDAKCRSVRNVCSGWLRLRDILPASEVDVVLDGRHSACSVGTHKGVRAHWE